MKRNQLSIDSDLAKGNFEVVFKADLHIKERYDAFGKDQGLHAVAVKTPLRDPANLTPIQTELENLKMVSKLQHQNIINFCGAFESRDINRIYLCTKLCGCGSLEKYLKSKKSAGASVPHEIQFEWAKQLCSGMRCLAEHNIMHCDLAARNTVKANFCTIELEKICVIN